VLAAALLARIATRSHAASPSPGSGTSWSKQWRDGIAVALHNGPLRVLIVIAAITALGEGIMGTLFAPFVRTVLHGTGSVYGTIVAVQALGGILGAVVVTALSGAVSPRRLLGYGAAGFGLLDLALFLYPLASDALWPAFVLMALVGLPGAATVAGLMTIFQTATTHTHRARLFGAVNTVEAITLITGTLAAGALGSALGIIPVIAVQGVGYLVAGGITLKLLPPHPTGPDPAAREPERATTTTA
jgi:Na+/melibiose symporter-like transporter